MNPILGMSLHTGVRLAEVGYLLILIAGLWLAAGQVPQFRFAAGRSAIAGLLIAVGAALVIIATHWAFFR